MSSAKRKAETVLACHKSLPQPPVSSTRNVMSITNLVVKIWTFVPSEDLKLLTSIDKKSRSMYELIYPPFSVFSHFGEFWNSRITKHYDHPILRNLWTPNFKQIKNISISIEVGHAPEVIKISTSQFRFPKAGLDTLTELRFIEFNFQSNGKISAWVTHRSSESLYLSNSEEEEQFNDAWDDGETVGMLGTMRNNIDPLCSNNVLSLENVQDIVYQLLVCEQVYATVEYYYE